MECKKVLGAKKRNEYDKKHNQKMNIAYDVGKHLVLVTKKTCRVFLKKLKGTSI